jgi:hypothetical protein
LKKIDPQEGKRRLHAARAPKGQSMQSDRRTCATCSSRSGPRRRRPPRD